MFLGPVRHVPKGREGDERKLVTREPENSLVELDHVKLRELHHEILR
jgi:hypothetical protein